MAGTANTDDFMLTTATVMLGAAEDLYDLNPEDNSIGMVKNFTITSEPAYTELTQGVKNTIVYSVLTANPVKATMEVYEYTAKNLGYSLGLEGAENLDALSVSTTLSSAVSAGSPAVDTISVTSATSFEAGDTIMIKVNDNDDFIIRKIDSIDTNDITLTRALPDKAIANGATVKKVNTIGIGSKTDQPFYAAKIAGKLVNGEEVVILIPKVRITKGFNLAFTSDNYANLPFEFTVYDLVSTDAFYTEFDGDQARLYRP